MGQPRPSALPSTAWQPANTIPLDAVLVTLARSLGEAVLDRIEADAQSLASGELARATWAADGEVLLAESLQEAAGIANERAPEHLQLMTGDDAALIPQLTAYGSLFVGHSAPVAFGDDVSGPNHTLPTGARPGSRAACGWGHSCACSRYRW